MPSIRRSECADPLDQRRERPEPVQAVVDERRRLQRYWDRFVVRGVQGVVEQQVRPGMIRI
jgi:hypothetical protein